MFALPLCVYPTCLHLTVVLTTLPCLPLTVVLTTLLYVALCMPRTALVVFLAFLFLFSHLCLYCFSISVTVCMILNPPRRVDDLSVLLCAVYCIAVEFASNNIHLALYFI